MHSIDKITEIKAAELVNLIIQGDRNAERLMVEKYHRGLLLMLRRKSTVDIAEDVAQETWRIVIEKVRGNVLRDAEKLAAYIVQTGRNQLIMYFRRNKYSGANDSGIVEELDENSPSALMERNQAGTLAHKLLGELKAPRDKEILMRYYINEEDKGDICAALSLSALHFNRVIHRAKQRLKALAEDLVKNQKDY